MKNSIIPSFKSSTALAAIITTIAMAPNVAHAGDVTVDVSVDYVSEYVFRGVSFANTAVQPAISVSKGGFTLGAWASTGLGETSAIAGDEIDIYGSYGWDVNDTVSASVGATVYHFPQSGDLFDFDSDTLGSTFEVSAGLGFNTVLSPAITAYYDLTLEAFTLEGSLSHSYPLAESVSLDFGLTGGFVTADGPGDYQWGTGSASLSYSFNDSSSVYAGANYTLNSDDLLDFPTANDITPTDNLFWAGVGVATSF